MPFQTILNFGSLWGLNNVGQNGCTLDADIDAPEACDELSNTAQVVVAVIDTGVDYTHPDLVANMWVNPVEIPGNSIDDDGNGYVDDVYGVKTITGTGDPKDDFFHGTHVADTIGAVQNNGIGVACVARNVKIKAVKFLDSTGSGYLSDSIEAIEYTRRMGAKIMNNSWGCAGWYDSGLRDAIAATGVADMIFAAAGNSTSDNDVYPFYPAGHRLENVVRVAATDCTDGLAYFSNYGRTTVDLGAPGYNILSTFPTYMTTAMYNYGFHTDYEIISGTSMATPHVAGALAMLKSEYPSMSHTELIQRLLDTVDPIAALSNKCVTGGRLNLEKAVCPVSTDASGRVANGTGSDVAAVALNFSIVSGNPSGASPVRWSRSP